MRNLFIANTPLHLLTAYILANSYTAGDENILILMNPKAADWGKSPALTKMSTDEVTWKNIINIEKKAILDKLKARGLKYVVNELRNLMLAQGRIEQVYLASDKLLENQLAVELSGNTSYIRFDEGSASYVYQKRSLKSQIAEYVSIGLFKWLAGLKAEMNYNFRGIGMGEAATADYLYKPFLLQRPSPKPVPIGREAIAKALTRLNTFSNIYEELQGGPTIIYLGSYLAERGEISTTKEIEALRKIFHMALDVGFNFLYKSHPSERANKLELYSKALPGIVFFKCPEPMEIIVHKYSNIKFLFTAVSTSTMLYADVFAERNLNMVSLINIVNGKLGPVDRLMRCAGVYTPSSFEDIRKMFRSYDRENQNGI